MSDVEEIVRATEYCLMAKVSYPISNDDLAAVLADWRAKKEEIERMRNQKKLTRRHQLVQLCWFDSQPCEHNNCKNAERCGKNLKEMCRQIDLNTEAMRYQCENIARKWKCYNTKEERLTAQQIANALAALATPQSAEDGTPLCYEDRP